jgi:periplasmic protein TonB
MVRPEKPHDTGDVKIPGWLAGVLVGMALIGGVFGIWSSLVQIGVISPLKPSDAPIKQAEKVAPLPPAPRQMAEAVAPLPPPPAPVEPAPEVGIAAQGDADLEPSLPYPPVPRPNPTDFGGGGGQPGQLVPIQPPSIRPPAPPVERSTPVAVELPSLGYADLRRPPTSQMMAAYYPSRAMEREKTGVVGLSCIVAGDGRLTRCLSTEETPGGFSFAERSITLAERELRARPTDQAGRPTDGRTIRLRIRWVLG